MTVRSDMIHCRVRGGPEDSLTDVANCCSAQWKYLYRKGDEAVLAKWTDVNVVRPD